MKKIKSAFFVVFFFTGIQMYAQTQAAVIEKLCKEYASAKPMQFNTVYNLYKNANALTIQESYKGAFIKNAQNDIYIKINKTEYYCTKTISAIIDHEDKIIALSNASPSIQQEYDINKLFENFKIGYFKDKKAYWEIELLSKYSNIPYNKIIIKVDKNYHIQKQTLYYTTAINYSNDFSKPDFDYPKLEIIYAYVATRQIPQSKFDMSSYFITSKKGIKLSATYHTYDLIDNRKQ